MIGKYSNENMSRARVVSFTMNRARPQVSFMLLKLSSTVNCFSMLWH